MGKGRILVVEGTETLVVPDVSATRQRKFTRRRFLRLLGGGGLAATGGLLGHGTLIVPYHPVVERKTVALPTLPLPFDGVRVALLSDLHVQSAFPETCLKPMQALIRREAPDLILLAGDYVYDQEPNRFDWMVRCAKALRGLKARLGVYAVFGNHDFPPPPEDPLLEPFETAGIIPLCNAVELVSHEKAAVALCGFRSALARPVLPSDVLQTVPGSVPKIVLWHEPDRAGDSALAGAILQVSGHTHGGQVQVPGIGPLVLPAGGKRYSNGLFHVNGMALYVTRGIGVLPPRVRINCPPEVTLLTLVRKPSEARRPT